MLSVLLVAVVATDDVYDKNVVVGPLIVQTDPVVVAAAVYKIVHSKL